MGETHARCLAQSQRALSHVYLAAARQSNFSHEWSRRLTSGQMSSQRRTRSQNARTTSSPFCDARSVHRSACECDAVLALDTGEAAGWQPSGRLPPPTTPPFRSSHMFWYLRSDTSVSIEGEKRTDGPGTRIHSVTCVSVSTLAQVKTTARVSPITLSLLSVFLCLPHFLSLTFSLSLYRLLLSLFFYLRNYLRTYVRTHSLFFSLSLLLPILLSLVACFQPHLAQTFFFTTIASQAFPSVLPDSFDAECCHSSSPLLFALPRLSQSVLPSTFSGTVALTAFSPSRCVALACPSHSSFAACEPL